MKAAELKNMTSAELTSKLKELKSELFKLRFQNEINQLDNPHKIADVKKDIAKIKTVQRERELAAK